MGFNCAILCKIMNYEIDMNDFSSIDINFLDIGAVILFSSRSKKNSAYNFLEENDHRRTYSQKKKKNIYYYNELGYKNGVILKNVKKKCFK